MRPGDGGGSASDYDNAALSGVTRDIETYLGYLKGNELVRDYVNQLRQLAECNDENQRLAGCTTKPSDAQYAVTFNYMLTVVGDGEVDANRDLQDKVQTEVDKAFQNGITWASGIAGYLQELCDPLTEPNIGGMHSVVQGLRQVQLFSLFTADFAADGKRGIPFGETMDNWVGGAHDQFVTFYNTLADRGRHYEAALKYAGQWIDATGALIGAARGGLVGFFKGVRGNLEDQLGQWAATMGHPKSYAAVDIPDWVPDLLSVGKDIIDAIPVVNDFARVPEYIVKAGQDVNTVVKDTELIKKYADKYLPDGQRKRPSSFTLESAEKIYTSMTSTLQQDFVQALKKELDKLASSRTQPFRQQIEKMKGAPGSGSYNDTWDPFKVPTTMKNDDWSYKDPTLR